jgi:hypothetical protein
VPNALKSILIAVAAVAPISVAAQTGSSYISVRVENNTWYDFTIGSAAYGIPLTPTPKDPLPAYGADAYTSYFGTFPTKSISFEYRKAGTADGCNFRAVAINYAPAGQPPQCNYSAYYEWVGTTRIACRASYVIIDRNTCSFQAQFVIG